MAKPELRPVFAAAAVKKALSDTGIDAKLFELVITDASSKDVDPDIKRLANVIMDGLAHEVVRNYKKITEN